MEDKTFGMQGPIAGILFCGNLNSGILESNILDIGSSLNSAGEIITCMYNICPPPLLISELANGGDTRSLSEADYS